jgi:tetratricopeptide (TPR) repeat protein
MIPVSNSSSTPIGGPAAYDAPADPQGEDAATSAATTPAPSGASANDTWARFGAENGMHAQVQQFAYASPNGPTGGQSGANAAPVDIKAQRAQAQTLMDEGVKLLKAHKYEAAIAKFQQGYQLVPSPAFIMNEAAALRDSGRYAEAVVTYQRYLADPAAPRAAEVRQAMDEAQSHLGGRTYTAGDIADAKRLTDEGITAYREGRYEDAYQAWGQAYEHNPIPMRLYDQGICLQQLNGNYAAAKLFRQYAAADPKPQDAEAAQRRGDHLLERARQEPITAGGRAGGQEWMERGNELLLAHRFNEAVAAYDEGFRTFPSEKILLNKASALLDGGRYAEADLAYGRYLSNPDAPRADEARAAQLRAREHMSGREATITGVAESERLMDEGGALYKAGKFADALQAFDRAYTLNPRAELRYNQAACMEKMGAHEMAASRYEDYLKEAPGANDAGKVRDHIAKVHEKAKSLSQNAFDRAQEAYVAGDFKKAAGAFIEAYSHLPKPDFLYNAGAAFDKAGDAMQAVRYYQLYLNMAPNAPGADKVRERITDLHKANGSALEKPVDPQADAKLKLAQQAFDKGQKAWNEGRYVDASRHYAEAYAQRPFPQFIYNVGASLHKAGDTMGAVKAYQQYLNALPNAPDADKVRKAIQILLEKSGDGLMKPGS